MINYHQALDAIQTHLDPLQQKRVKLEDSPGYVLARRIVARYDLPLFDQSAMDGYAVRCADVSHATAKSPAHLTVAGTIFAGDDTRPRVKPGTAVKIMTGAGVPPGADAVVKREFCDESEGQVVVQKAVTTGTHIRRRGGEFKKGAEILPPGVRITPPVVGLLATCGCATVFVHRKPKISLVVTGNELVAPGQRLRRGQIYDANSYTLAAALQEMGVAASSVVRLQDEKSALKRGLGRALRSADVLIVSGGVSVGDRDYVKGIFEELGVRTVFWRAAVKPGKPTYFGTYRPAAGKKHSRKLVFGLPGNPVSVLVTFRQYVQPALLRLMGMRDEKRIFLPATLQKSLRKKTPRLEWVRGSFSVRRGTLFVTPTTGQESHMLGGLARANCLIEFPRRETFLEKGATVNVELLQWGA